MTLLYTHPSGYSHATPPGHPEQVARLDAVLGALDGLDLIRRDAPDADDADILRGIFVPPSAIRAARRAEDEAERALNALNVLPSSVFKSSLVELSKFAVARKY